MVSRRSANACIVAVLHLLVVASGTSIRVLGAGLARTGTQSLTRALERLGYSTYHMSTVFHRGHLDTWGKVAQGLILAEGALDAALDVLQSEGFDAAVGFPVSCAYERVLERHPDALVVLSRRSSAAVWARSYSSTLGRAPVFLHKAPLSWFFPNVVAMTGWIAERTRLNPLGFEPQRSSILRAYELWNAEIRERVPKHQLLEWEPEDGWEPLCTFLKVIDGECPSDQGEEFPQLEREDPKLHTLCSRLEYVVENWSWLAPLLFVVITVSLYLGIADCFGLRKQASEEKLKEA